MAKLILVSFSLLLLSLSSVCYLGSADVKTYCVAKPSTDEAALKNNIMFACADSKVHCKNYHDEGRSCHQPNTTINKASVAMNLYYQANGRNYWNCNFTNSGLITITDPSYYSDKGLCSYN